MTVETKMRWVKYLGWALNTGTAAAMLLSGNTVGAINQIITTVVGAG